MAFPSDEEMAELAKRFPDAKLTKYSALENDFVIRRPNRMEFKRYRQQLLNEETRADASESLQCCVVWSNPKSYDAFLNEFAAAEPAINKEILSLAGAEAKLEKKAS